MAVIYRCLNCGFEAPGEGGIAQCAQCGTPVEPVEGELDARDVAQMKKEGAGMVPQRPVSAWVERSHGVVIMDDPTPEEREALKQWAEQAGRARVAVDQEAADAPAVTLESIDLE